MDTFEIRTNQPIKYHICGNLRTSDGFLHHKRSMDLHVLIVVLKGTLYLRIEDKNITVRSGQYILLRAGEEHEGWKPSEGELSYFWVHFSAQDTGNDSRDIKGQLDPPGGIPFGEGNSSDKVNVYQLPERGELPATQRVTTLFRQLLDLSRTWQEGQGQMLDYCCSILLMELTLEIQRESSKGEFTEPGDHPEPLKPQIQQTIREAMEYISMNCHKQIEPAMVAQHFHYNPDYFASLFRKQTGMTITQYLNKMRIELAKRLLVNENVSIKEAAYSSGFQDEKYFMRIFKRQEGMTPLAYKTAFQKSFINH